MYNDSLHVNQVLNTYRGIGGDTILINKSSGEGQKIFEGKEMYSLEVGEEKSFYENGQVSYVGHYKIIDENRKKRAEKDGIFKYYHPNGALKAEINFTNGKELGKSYYYDDSGELVRIKEIKANSEILNIFKGDTVNRTDAHGLKQGKWISFSKFYHADWLYQPNKIEYFKDNNPIGTWEYYHDDEIKPYEKIIWVDSLLARYFRYDYAGMLMSEGYKINLETKTGLWKEYDRKSGYLKTQGEYLCDKKEGTWLVFRKSGKLKKELTYKNNILTKTIHHGIFHWL